MPLVQCFAPNNLGMETLIYIYFAILLNLCALQRTEQLYLNKLPSCPNIFNQYFLKINSSDM